MQLKANWTHDCEECNLIGTFLSLGSPMDVYLHVQEDESETLIIRDGDAGPAYRSQPVWAAKLVESTLWQSAIMMYRSFKGE